METNNIAIIKDVLERLDNNNKVFKEILDILTDKVFDLDKRCIIMEYQLSCKEPCLQQKPFLQTETESIKELTDFNKELKSDLVKLIGFIMDGNSRNNDIACRMLIEKYNK